MDVLLYAVFDWLEGHREVFAIDSDINMLTVVSDYKDFLLFAVDPLETPCNGCDYIRYLRVTLIEYPFLYASTVQSEVSCIPAVIESVLGGALDIVVLAFLQESETGKVWLDLTRSTDTTVDDEARRYFALHDTTSCIMYWGLANDLLAIEHDESGVGGLHLVRQSTKFAFANVSMETLLSQQGVLFLPCPSTGTL
ncbi:hypothetical protein DYB37_002912 [Aphanomyces astaci]|uniref:Uncharacterized protein n=1 Tax=Aphanomyces astaci TaxID=112090 RepID=A0A3L6V798_APHAT|nr:hypothetical protein DYB35_003088 [Aphanomyces astaci]RHZ23380.1 hypothetical protein DYB37_002912 [Aphanomyces astaci]RLO04644.1 hypothetical protein DYB28_005142 [Aphanomyces astaci]